MKHKFSRLFSLLLIAAMSMGAMADTAIVSWTTSDQQGANSITGVSSSGLAGWTLAITGNSTKNWSAGNGDITYSEVTYKTLKNSNGAANTFTLPTGYNASKVDFYVTANADADGALSEFNGEDCTDAVSSHKDYSNPTHIEKTLATPANSFTFTFSTKQVCFIMVVTYSGSAGSGEDPGEDPDPDAPTTGTIEDLVTIDDAFTFEPTAALEDNTLYEGKKIISLGGSSYKNGVQIKNNRQLAFKVAAGAKIIVTFKENSTRSMQIGTSSAATDLASSASSPVTAIRATAGIVYISASSDLYLTKLEIQYPHTITYNLNGGTGTTPTQASKYVGETFTAHNGTTGITAPAGKEFEKWKDQDNTDVAAGATYTMPAKNVTLTAQWRNETVKYAVTYDLNGYTAGVAPTETNKAAGDVFAIKSAPSWTDHDFLGWTCNIDAQTYQASDNYTMTAATTTFTAQWQAYFTITYKDGDDVLDTEKVNAGDSPVGIADPAKELKSFLGWTLVGESTLVDPTTLTENTVLVAKWADFDGCAYLAVDLTATAKLAVGDNLSLKSTSFGGSVIVANLNSTSGDGSIKYHANGLYLSGGGKDSLRVTIGHQLQEGSKITVALRCTGTGTRGLKLLTNAGAEVAALGWSSGVANAEGTFTYEVPENSALIGEKDFRLQRNNTVYLKYVSVEDCAPQDFTVTYKEGSSTLGTEFVFENEHPTASSISTRKNGYVFEGWAETDGGSVVDLDDITITADKTLYAIYLARVCASGSKFKFQLKTDLTSGNMFSYAPVPATAMTTENFLAELTGGELEVSNTNNSNDRIVISDQKAIGFAKGDGGKLTLKLDCPLQENDEIRFINYAKSGNSITLSDGTNSTTLDGNGAQTVQTFVVPEAWETTGSYELTMVRDAGTAKLTSFEIYRRPILSSVTLEDLNLKVGATGTPVMTLNPEGALVTSEAWAITASTATGTTINAETGLITAGETAGQLTVQVTLNSNKVATCTVKVVPGYESVQPVSETTTWQWEGVLAANANIAEGDTVLANYYAGEQWEKIAGKKGEYAYRAENYDCYQGTYLYFKATVPGILTIYARYASACTMSVNGNEVADLTNSYQTYYAAVPAGNVFITSTAAMRIKSMKFDTDMQSYAITDNAWGGYDREVTAGNYGTICLPNGGVMAGASIFEIAYFDNAQRKIFFDEVVDGYMVAGRPHIFLPNEGETELKVYYTDNANATAGDYRGLYGFFDTSDDNAIKKLAENDYFLYNNQYYVVDHAAVGLVAVGNYRAYIKLSDIDGYPTTPAPGRRRVAMSVNGEQVATGVENVTDANAPRKVLIDGRMFIMLGEKMYDVTGQIAK